MVSAFNPRLRTIKGDIYNLDERQYDAAVVFVKQGFNTLSADLSIKEGELEKSKIGYLIFTNSPQRKPYFIPHKAYLRDFASQEEAEDYIREMVNYSLDLALRGGNRIAFHGVQIHGMDEGHNEEVTVKAVKEWLERNPDATVTLVDRFQSFFKFMGREK